MTFDPREEPGALAAHAGICAGASRNPPPYRDHWVSVDLLLFQYLEKDSIRQGEPTVRVSTSVRHSPRIGVQFLTLPARPIIAAAECNQAPGSLLQADWESNATPIHSLHAIHGPRLG